MELKDYRKKHRYSLRALAEEIGCTGQMLSIIETGKGYPSRVLALKIQAFTQGEVKAIDLLGIGKS